MRAEYVQPNRPSFFSLYKNKALHQSLLASTNLQSTSEISSIQRDSSSVPLTCRYCNISFSHQSLFRSHCKEDSHVYNLKKLAIRQPDCENNDTASGNIVVQALNGEPTRIWLFHEPTNCHYGFLKALVTRRDSPRSCPVDWEKFNQILYNSSTLSYVILLATSGHFAGAVFSGTEVVVHKAFHRYVIRAKQGHAQSKRDGAGNRCQSAGAGLRRRNEAAFIVDIQNLLAAWAPDYFGNASCIFIHCPHRMLGTFFDKDNGSLRLYSDKVRSIPLMIGRPTFDLCKDVAAKLFSICVIDDSEFQSTTIQSRIEESEFSEELCKDLLDLSILWSDNESEKEAFQDTSIELLNSQDSKPTTIEISGVFSASNPDKTFDELYTSCRSSDEERLKKSLTSFSGDIVPVLQRTFGPYKETLLHMISKTANSSNMVDCLLSFGCDPTLEDTNGSTAYQVANEDAVRETFIKFRLAFPLKYNWQNSHVPEKLEMPQQKKRKRRSAKKDKSVSGSAKVKASTVEIEAAEKDKFVKLTDAEKRSLRANRCFFCGTKYEQGSSFDYLSFRFCSVQCLRTHRFNSKQL